MNKFSIASCILAATMFSPALSADAIVEAEPEPTQYVKICDAYGSGWIYIPGSERCLKLSGDIRAEYKWTKKGNTRKGKAEWRGRFNVYTAEESEAGTLTTRIRMTAYGDGQGSYTPRMDVATFGLTNEVGAVKLGYGDNYWTTAHGYGYRNAAADGYYTYDKSLYAQATATAGNAHLTAGIQWTNRRADLEPDYYLGATTSFGSVNLAGTLVYDASQSDMAWKLSSNWQATEEVSFGGWYMGAGKNQNSYVDGKNAWGLWANISTLKWDVYAGYSDASNKRGSATIGARYHVTEGLYIQPEVAFLVTGRSNTTARLRVVRSF